MAAVDPYDTGFVDLEGSQGLLRQREGCTSQSVVDWLVQQSVAFREAILFVAIDPAAVYAKAVRTLNPDGTRLLPNARLVVDHFHLVQLANDGVTKVRRRVIWEQKGRRGPRSTRCGRTAGGCSPHANACQTGDSPRCGTG